MPSPLFNLPQGLKFGFCLGQYHTVPENNLPSRELLTGSQFQGALDGRHLLLSVCISWVNLRVITLYVVYIFEAKRIGLM